MGTKKVLANCAWRVSIKLKFEENPVIEYVKNKVDKRPDINRATTTSNRKLTYLVLDFCFLLGRNSFIEKPDNSQTRFLERRKKEENANNIDKTKTVNLAFARVVRVIKIEIAKKERKVIKKNNLSPMLVKVAYKKSNK